MVVHLILFQGHFLLVELLVRQQVQVLLVQKLEQLLIMQSQVDGVLEEVAILLQLHLLVVHKQMVHYQ